MAIEPAAQNDPRPAIAGQADMVEQTEILAELDRDGGEQGKQRCGHHAQPGDRPQTGIDQHHRQRIADIGPHDRIAHEQRDQDFAQQQRARQCGISPVEPHRVPPVSARAMACDVPRCNRLPRPCPAA
nr:hypothetical protein [uncultured Sphingomonas sp.]